MGSIEGESKLEGVSANAVKALDDIREFLPYKNYRVVDTQLMRSAGRMEGLVSGPEGQDYRVEMGFTANPEDAPRSAAIDRVLVLAGSGRDDRRRLLETQRRR